MSPVYSVSSCSAESESPENVSESNKGFQSNDVEYSKTAEEIEKEKEDVERNTEITERSSEQINDVTADSSNILVISTLQTSALIHTTVSESLSTSLTSKDITLQDKEMKISDNNFTFTESTTKVKSFSLAKASIPKIDCEKEANSDGSHSIEERMYVVKSFEKKSAKIMVDENESKNNLVISVSKSFQFTEFVNERPAEYLASPTTHEKENYAVRKRKRKKKSGKDRSFQLEDDIDEILKLWGCHTEKSGAETSDKKLFQEYDHVNDHDNYEVSRFQERNAEKYDTISELSGSTSENKDPNSHLSEFIETVQEKDISHTEEKKKKLWRYQPLMESIKKKNPNPLFQSTKYPDIKELRRRGIDKENKNISYKTAFREDDEEDGELDEITLEVRS